MYNSEIVTAKVTSQMMMSTDENFYHTIHHVDNMLKMYEERQKEFNLEDDTNLKLAIYYHDIVYVPGALNNEEESAKYTSNEDVKRLILSTKVDFNYKFAKKDEQVLHTLDWVGFADFNMMYSNHQKIFMEALHQRFIPLTIHENQIKFYKRLHAALKYEGYKIDFFNDENNQKAIKNLETLWSMQF